MDKYRNDVLSFMEKAKEKQVIVYDTETTGLSADECDIIEFSAIKVNVGADGVLVLADELDIYIKVDYPLSGEIINITGITDELLQTEGINGREATIKIAEFLGDKPLLMGYNSISFDTRFVNALFNKYPVNGYEFEVGEQIDVLKMAKEKLEKPHKLSEVATRINTEKKYTFHRSIDDAKATLDVFNYLYPMYVNKEPDIEASDFKVTGVKRWCKYGFERIYVSNNKNLSIYYDIKEASWYIGGNIDTDTVLALVYTFTNTDSVDELVQKVA